MSLILSILMALRSLMFDVLDDRLVYRDFKRSTRLEAQGPGGSRSFRPTGQ